MDNSFPDDRNPNSFSHLRNMLLPINSHDPKIIKIFKNSIFCFAAITMFVSTILLFLAVLIAA